MIVSPNGNNLEVPKNDAAVRLHLDCRVNRNSLHQTEQENPPTYPTLSTDSNAVAYKF